ncbi:hypothetical protein [Enterobacter ludwigii]|uniref:hypothetical protein n=1 Tax=Enterobacter ludwigii TaxID=299767 RepID=UPI002F429042
MTTKQNAIVLARTARSEATNTAKRTISAIISNWNECVKQSGFTGVFDFPTTGYTRKSQLVAELLRCADQLDEYVEPNPHAAQTVEQQTREFNAALTRVLDVESAHSEAVAMDNQFHFNAHPEWKRQLIETAHREALEMNEEFDCRRSARSFKAATIQACHAAALEMDDELNHSKSKAEMEESAISISPPDLAQRAFAFRLNYTPEGRERRIREAHSEALEINAAIDSMIQARQQIANKEPDFLQETWDLVRLGNSYKEAGREWYRWAKATALRLWESSLAQRQILQA